MAEGTRETRALRTGASVSLAAALAVGIMAGAARPALATTQFEESEQVVDDSAQMPAEVAELSPAEATEQTPDAIDQPADELAPTSEQALTPAPEAAPLAESAAPPAEPPSPETPSQTTPAPSLDTAAEATSYDPRATEGTSAIRDQFWGTCWAMSGISSTESYLIHNGLASTDVQLSVEDVLWWIHQSDWNMQQRETAGLPAMTIGYLTTVGARSEQDIPYLGKPSDFRDGDLKNQSPSNIYGSGENLRPTNYDTAPVAYEVTDVVFVKNPSHQEIKDQITTYGAITAAYKLSEDSFDPVHSTEWGNGKYDESGEELYESNHLVSVVGWDGSFPKEYFVELNGKRPQQDGAWIIKNSLGTGYGSDGGFTFVSYDDEFLFTVDGNKEQSFCYAIAGVRTPVDQARYMHDQHGSVASWQPAGSTSCTWANVFDFGSGEQLNELSFVTWSKGDHYALYYAPVIDGVPSTDESTWVSLAEGTIEHAGYTTVASSWHDIIPSGKGAIVLKVTGAAPSVGIARSLTNVRGAPLYNVDDQGARGKGYYLQNGDFTEAAIMAADGELDHILFSIRAYTIARAAPADDGQDTAPSNASDTTPPAGKSNPQPTPRRTTASAARLPQTGDESHVLPAALALVGAALASIGASLRRAVRAD